MADRVIVVGMPGNDVPQDAALYAGGRRHLDTWSPGGPAIIIGSDLDAALDAIEATAGTVCVLASGDPGFFGIVRPLAARFGSDLLDVRPAPSSISLAFARLGLPWDDATVVSAHGRPLPDAARAVLATPSGKAAVLVSPEAPPEALAEELLALGADPKAHVAVCSRLGLADEAVLHCSLEEVAHGSFDPLAVVVLVGERRSTPPSLAWGLPDTVFAHRAGMITKAEVRAVALGRLDLPPAGVMWDVGAGSGSVAVECARLVPGLPVFAVERRPDDAERVRQNAVSLGATIAVVQGEAPAAFDGLPDPHRVFLGGGGLEVLDAVLQRLRPDGLVVATFASVDRAAAAAERLGGMSQISVARGEQLPDGGWRLAAENPVFVCWGPERNRS